MGCFLADIPGQDPTWQCDRGLVLSVVDRDTPDEAVAVIEPQMRSVGFEPIAETITVRLGRHDLVAPVLESRQHRGFLATSPRKDGSTRAVACMWLVSDADGESLCAAYASLAWKGQLLPEASKTAHAVAFGGHAVVLPFPCHPAGKPDVYDCQQATVVKSVPIAGLDAAWVHARLEENLAERYPGFQLDAHPDCTVGGVEADCIDVSGIVVDSYPRRVVVAWTDTPQGADVLQCDTVAVAQPDLCAALVVVPAK